MNAPVSPVLTCLLGVLALAAAPGAVAGAPFDGRSLATGSGCDAMRPTRLALVADTHILRKSNDRLDRNRRHLDRVIESVNAANVDLVLIAGDLTEDGDAADFKAFARQIARFNAVVSVVPGNHDTGGKRVPGKPNSATDVNHWRLWRYEWVFGESYFVRVRAGVRVVGVNSPLLGSGLRQERRMWRFLQAKLSRPCAEPTVFLLHYPLFLQSPDEPGGDYWSVEPEPRRRLLALIEQTGACAVLSGHLHHRLTNDYQGVLCYTASPSSFGLPEGEEPEGWGLVTVTPPGNVAIEFQPIAVDAKADSEARSVPAAFGKANRRGWLLGGEAAHLNRD